MKKYMYRIAVTTIRVKVSFSGNFVDLHFADGSFFRRVKKELWDRWERNKNVTKGW